MNLWVFGCSHATREHNLSNDEKSWIEIVSETLSLNPQVYSKGGSSNDEILEKIIQNLDIINEEDQIIVMMTFPERIMYDGQRILPSEDKFQWWYKIVNSDDFYYRKFLTNFLSIAFLLFNKKAIITFVDPTLIIKNMSPTTKKIVKNQSTFLPKLTLRKSFPLGADKKHLSKEGHIMLAEFFIKLIDSANQSN